MHLPGSSEPKGEHANSLSTNVWGLGQSNSFLSEGIWIQHMNDVDRPGAAVRGLRFFFEGCVAPDSHILGSSGYITILPDTLMHVSIDFDPDTGSAQLMCTVALTSRKSFLQQKNAWNSNVRGLRACSGRKVPVLAVHHGRPRNKMFGDADAFLGDFHCEEIDIDDLGCSLVMRASDASYFNQLKIFLESFMSKRTTELPPMEDPQKGQKSPHSSSEAIVEPSRKRRLLGSFTPIGALIRPSENYDCS